MDRPARTAKKAVLWKYVDRLEAVIEHLKQEFEGLHREVQADRKVAEITIEGLHREMQADRKVAEITETALKSCESANRDLHAWIERLESAVVIKFVKDVEGDK